MIRGHADAAALAVACHDPACMPSSRRRAAKRARCSRRSSRRRVEAIGAQRMEGVSANLTARLEQRYERSRINESTDRSEAPLPEALALLVRERLTGLAPPTRGPRHRQSLAPVDREAAREPCSIACPTRSPTRMPSAGWLATYLPLLNLADQLDQTGEEGQAGKEGEPEPSAAEADTEDAGGRAGRVRLRRPGRPGLHER